MLLVWLKFLVCTLIIVFTGTKLSKYGDIIAEKTSLGRALTGLMLLAVITSLPEVFAGISAVVIVEMPNLALGDVMGSCMFNLLIIAIMDLLYKDGPLLFRVSNGHIVSAGCSILLLGVTTASILLSCHLEMLKIGWIGIYTLIIPVIYFLSMRSIFYFEKARRIAFHKEEDEYKGISLKATCWKFVLSAMVIIGASIWLPKIGAEIAEITGLGQSFVGTLFLAATTSLPELVVSIAALRIGAADMAVGNIFGSNLFNMVVIAIDDLFYTKGPILADVSQSNILTGLLAIMMSSVIIVSLLYESKKKSFGIINWDALFVILFYISGFCLLFLMET
ncbi:sodium:calcium antiporter [bacterium]|nr:sodium:calcium antiporter [bacterium]MBU1753095.1 sodium:calcium antiporter [bacterium]